MNLVEELANEISRLAGLRIEEGWESIISAALSDFKEEPTLDPQRRAALLSEIACRITVPETHFFRNHAQLAYCAEHLVGVNERESRVAHLWCAGSATGEEPYTLAMLLHQRVGRRIASNFELTACDLSSESVEKARRAIYTAWSFRGSPTWCLRYFENEGSSLRLAHDEVLRAVSFTVQSCQDAARARRDASLDVVTFRNVAIYMEDWAIQALHEQFSRVLRVGGLLALAASDPHPSASCFELLGYYDNCPVFVRKSDSRTSLLASLDPGTEASQTDRASVTEAAFRAEPASPEPYRSSETNSADEQPGGGPQVREISTKDDVRLLEMLSDSVPDETTPLRLLGQAFLERNQAERAVSVLRQAVFLDAEDPLSRYFLALALRESGATLLASRQLNNVMSFLVKSRGDALLSDSTTTAAELLASARYLEGQWK